MVVGAGPAGGAAAGEAASRGMRVALIEKYPLPRHKTCGGGIPMTMSDLVKDLAPETVIECNTTRFRLTYDFERPVLSPLSHPDDNRANTIWMTQRSVFDFALVRRAADKGVSVFDGAAVRSVEPGTSGVVVRAENADGRTALEISADRVIGADGANGLVAKAAALRRKRALAIGMEVEVPFNWVSRHPDLDRTTAHLEFGAVKDGYAWVFPKNDHLNVGAGVFRPSPDGRGDRSIPHLLRSTIHRYLDHLQVPYSPEALHYYAHPLPIWNGREPLHTRDGRILLIGDAAGLINPFFGDGILHAVHSGIIAAGAVADGAPSEHTRRIHQHFARNFDASARVGRFFYQFPQICYTHGASRPAAGVTAARLLSGELAFHEISGRVLRRLGRFVGVGA